MHFRFYRGTGASFLNLSRVDIWTRQVFVDEGTCALQGVSQRPWPLPTGCSSHLLPQSWQKNCVQTLLFLVEPLSWSECRVSSVFQERNTPHLAWVMEVELRWTDGTAETRRWTQQYLGGQTHHDDPVLSILSLFPSFNIPPALKKESGLVLEILNVGWQRTVCGMQSSLSPCYSLLM